MSFKTVQPGDPPWLKDAFAHLGLKEIAGPEHNPAIVKMFVDLGHDVRDDETSWCAVSANWFLWRQGIEVTGEMTARSFLDLGTAVRGKPRRGDIVVIKRGTKGWQGHVFFWLADDGEYIWGIGGNQGKFGSISVARFPKSKLLGIRRPPKAASDAPVPKPRPTVPAYDDELVLAIQQALWDRGYKQVGLRDGDYGPDTRAAIFAFEGDHSLKPTGIPTGDLLAAILASEPRVLAPERSGASPADVRDQVPEVKASWLARIGAQVMGAVAALFAFIGGILENIGGAREWVQPVIDVAGDVPGWAYALAVAGVAIWLYLQSRKAETAGTKAFQTGERR